MKIKREIELACSIETAKKELLDVNLFPYWFNWIHIISWITPNENIEHAYFKMHYSEFFTKQTSVFKIAHLKDNVLKIKQTNGNKTYLSIELVKIDSQHTMVIISCLIIKQFTYLNRLVKLKRLKTSLQLIEKKLNNVTN